MQLSELGEARKELAMIGMNPSEAEEKVERLTRQMQAFLMRKNVQVDYRFYLIFFQIFYSSASLLKNGRTNYFAGYGTKVERCDLSIDAEPRGSRFTIIRSQFIKR